MASTNTLTFKVQRQNPELIPPAKPTPHEFKPLSDIDDQDGLRFQIPFIQFYPKNPAMDGKDPVKVIRDAVARALVFYYPFAGRLREMAGRKLVVECTGEGILFIGADADVTLQQFGDTVHPPFPCIEELLYDVPGSDGVVNCPLLLIQVTRLKCGGFIFSIRLNHTMSDAVGIVQFMTAVGELARGAETPSIQPVWQRDLLNARDPPHVSFTHHEYDDVSNAKGTLTPLEDMVHRSFFFGAAEISTLRSRLPPYLPRCSTFDLLAVCLWRFRTIAISPDPNEEIRIVTIVDSRRRFNPPLPAGYYGNAVALSTAMTTAGSLANNPLDYALELVQKTKSEVTEEYMKSVADLMVIRGRPHFTTARTYMISDVTRVGFENVDFGWGTAAYGGPAKAGIGEMPAFGSFFARCKNNKGESGIVVPVCLPAEAMRVFVEELETMLTSNDDDDVRTALKSSVFQYPNKL
ncbi:Benzyl alcohol O-benzoyltransferase [Sesamum alatum]|uniref:Benzyl alcohol O-benzoyltransferase n=1 Tax=Sesamum alatum TaxID=300844 RepID=A0AAE2CQ53_9LAMI|nr:Benzyl alcohol O-benzoyltransferase [Sesamum alatum]